MKYDALAMGHSAEGVRAWRDERGATGRRRALLAALAFALALACVAASVLPASAQLASNIAETAAGDDTWGASLHVSQEFTTGSEEGVAGYLLGGIRIVSANANSFAVAIYTTDGGAPDEKVADLIAPATFSEGTLTFTAPANTGLAANTTYAVVVSTSGVFITVTTTSSNDEAASAGWSIGNTYRTGTFGGSWTADPTRRSLRIAIYPPNLVSNIGQTASTDDSWGGSLHVSQEFTTGDKSEGYVLGDIRIVSPDANSFAVAIYTTTAGGAPNEKVADLTAPATFSAGTLTFTAPANTRLAANTTYALVVSTSGSRIMVTTTASNNEAASAGWSIGDVYRIGTFGDSWAVDPTSKSLRIAIYEDPVILTPSAQVLVSNMGQESREHTYGNIDQDYRDYYSRMHTNFSQVNFGGGMISGGIWYDPFVILVAQAFTTGPNPDGYRLTAIRFNMSAPDIRKMNEEKHATPKVWLYTNGTSTKAYEPSWGRSEYSVPWRRLFEMDLVGELKQGDLTYSPRQVDGSYPLLEPNTTYQLAMRTELGIRLIAWTNSNSEDSGGAPGWDIENHSDSYMGFWGPDNALAIPTDEGVQLYQDDPRHGWIQYNPSLKIEIQGTIVTGGSPLMRFSREGRSLRRGFSKDIFFVRAVQENAAPGTNVGEPVTGTDPDGDKLTYTLFGKDANAFEIDSATGQIRTIAGVIYDYEIKSSYSVSVSADDGNGNVDTIAGAIRLTNDVDEVLTARFQEVPAEHVGALFTLKLGFSERIVIAEDAMRDHALTVTNGRVTLARRLDNTGDTTDDMWEFLVEPTGGSVSVSVPATTDCGASGAICTTDGRMLSSKVTTTIAQGTLQSLTATFANIPAEHLGSGSGDDKVIAFDIDFTAAVTATPEAMRDHVLTVTNGQVTFAQQRESGRADRWRVSLRPSSLNDMTISLPATTDCGASGAICASDGRVLSSGQEVTIIGPASKPLTVSRHLSPPIHDGESRFNIEIDFSWPVTTKRTVLRDQVLQVTNGTVVSVKKIHYRKQGRWRFSIQPSADALITISVPVTTSDCNVEGAVCTADGRKLSNALEITVGFPTQSQQTDESNTANAGEDNTGQGDSNTANARENNAGQTVEKKTPLTASFTSMPTTHDGSAFTFDLHFDLPSSATFSIGFEAMRDDVLSVSGGAVTNASRLADVPRNTGWEITVQPSSNADVTISLSPTTDCSATGAICTSDGTMQSSSLSATVTASSANDAPTADAGSDQTVEEGSVVTLSGTASDPDNDNLTYQWTHDRDDLGISLDDPTALSTTFTAPEVDSDATITFTLTATDEHGATGSDAVAVTVQDVPASSPQGNTVVLEPPDPRGTRDIGRITLVSSQPGKIQGSWEAPTEEPDDYRISWAKEGESFKTWTDNTGNAFPTEPSYTITGLDGGEKYKVKVRARYGSSPGAWSGEAVITVIESPASKPVVPSLTFGLGANYPNPFNPETQIAYTLSETGPVELAIYNVLGQRVRTLVQEVQAAGRYQVVWNGRNDSGVSVASGIYLYRLSSAQGVQVRRLLLLK